MESAATILPVDLGAYSYLQNGSTQSSAGRDVGLRRPRLPVRRPAGVSRRRVLRRATREWIPAGDQHATRRWPGSAPAAGAGSPRRMPMPVPISAEEGAEPRRGARRAGELPWRGGGRIPLAPVGRDGVSAQVNFIHYDGHELGAHPIEAGHLRGGGGLSLQRREADAVGEVRDAELRRCGEVGHLPGRAPVPGRRYVVHLREPT